jgi:hypothetical protein
MAQLIGRFDRIMIGQREQIHAAAIQALVNLLRVAITLAAKFSDKGSSAEAREVRVDMHVALHESHDRMPVLLQYDAPAKVLKTQIFNSFDTYSLF